MDYDKIKGIAIQLREIHQQLNEMSDDERIIRSDYFDDEPEFIEASQNINWIGNAKDGVLKAMVELANILNAIRV